MSLRDLYVDCSKRNIREDACSFYNLDSMTQWLRDSRETNMPHASSRKIIFGQINLVVQMRADAVGE